MASTRLPGKPLAQIAGRPMIAWMVACAAAAGVGPVLVAAAEAEIAEAARAAGAQAVLTDPALPSGTDRVHAAAEMFDPGRTHDIVVNLQGDMPTIRPTDIARAVALLQETPEADIATLASPSDDPAERDNPNVVKAIVAWTDRRRLAGMPAGSRRSGRPSGRALYFTRAPAPAGDGPVWRHVGLYVFRRAALARFVAAPPSPLELREKLEQLRALELGMHIVVGHTDDFPKGVDSQTDLEAARAALSGR
jgi:3-deoxy-manno-octulosonate cytidylyltransferase (CMP-KDO synthetase)